MASVSGSLLALTPGSLGALANGLLATRYLAGGYNSESFSSIVDRQPPHGSIASGLACLLYDHILTFGDEYQRIWRGRRWRASIIFLVNRYVAFTTVSFVVSLRTQSLSEDSSWYPPS